MSLINQMLQDIERRESNSGAGNPQAPLRQHFSSGSAAAPQAAYWGWSSLLALAALAVLTGSATAWWLHGRPVAPAPATMAATTALVALAPVSAAPITTALVALAPVAAAPRNPPPPPDAVPLQSVIAAKPPPPEPALAAPALEVPAPVTPTRVNRESLIQAKPTLPATRPAAQATTRALVTSGLEKATSREPGTVAAVVVAARAAPPVTARAEQLYQQALAQSKQSQPDLALKFLREALDTQPSHVQARVTLARLLVDKKQGDAAADLLADGLMLLPQQSGFALALAPLWIQSGRQDDAMGLLAQSAKSAGDSPDYHAYYAAQLLQRKRHAEAVRHYSIALRSSPGTVDWLIGLGLSLQGAGNDKDALEAFKRAFDTASLSGKKRELVEQMIAGLKVRLGL